jgi:membrane associated rhomboid family serine protease
MLLPYSDDNSDRTITPYVNYALIGANILVFALLQRFGTNEVFTNGFSAVPAEIITGRDIVQAASQTVDSITGQTFEHGALYATPVSVYLTLITSIFMHGGFAHIAGNMLYLYLFGDNIENRLGHVKYFLFYMLTGIIASLSHVAATYFGHHDTLIPCLGASGAISAIMGAYMFLYPQNKVRALLFMYLPITVPAFVALGIWIGFQIINGLGLLGGASDGVAYAAHIGGFISGMLLIPIFAGKLTNR